MSQEDQSFVIHVTKRDIIYMVKKFKESFSLEQKIVHRYITTLPVINC